MCKDVSVAELPEKLSFLVQCSEVVGMEKTLIITEDPEEGWLCLSCLLRMEILCSVLSCGT